MWSLSLAVLFWSRSTEHDVSITSAFAVYKALERTGHYTLYPIYISRSGARYLQQNLDKLDSYEDFVDNPQHELSISLTSSDNKLHLFYKKTWLFSQKKELIIDIVFPVLHGKAWEDGSIQWFCEMLSVPYVWPRIASAALCLDKTISNYVIETLAVWTIPTQVVRSIDEVKELLPTIAYPVFVKPYNGWSTIGVSKCKNETELLQWAEVAFYFAHEVLIQKSIENARELNCSVARIDNEIITTHVQEVCSNEEYLTFDEKYIVETGWWSMSWLTNKVQIPADLPSVITERITAITKKIYIEFKLYGNARIDFLYQEKEDALYVIEINTIPGALQMYLREKSWVSKEKLLENLIQEALTYNTQRIGNIDFKSQILKNTSSFIKK